jgi:hypothetical protein
MTVMTDRRAHVDELRARPLEELIDAYAQLDALENAIRAERLAILGVLDERKVWCHDGAANTADWVALTSRVRRSTAADQVGVARRLRDLPELEAVAAEGRLSFDQLAPASKVATWNTDAAWATQAPVMSAAALEALARDGRTVSTEEAADRVRRRSLRWWNDPSHGMIRLFGRLPDVDGEVVTRALEQIAGRLARGPGGAKEPFTAHLADALTELASTHVAEEADGDRACVVLHVTETGAPTCGESDIPVANETARRLVCDSVLQALVKDALGNPVGLSPRRRTVSPALMRALRHRDRRCRFPGCERTRTLRAHHLVHAADGGPTEAANLACVCAWHHHLVHEGGWRVDGDPTRPDGLRFRRPDGRLLETTGPPLDPDIRRRFIPDRWFHAVTSRA